MKLKTAAIFAILLTALALLAQDTAQIFSELQQAAPASQELAEVTIAPVAPVVMPAVAPVVMPAVTPVVMPAVTPVVMPAEPTSREPVTSVEPARRELPIEPAPVIVVAAPVVKPSVEPAPAVAVATSVAQTPAVATEDVVETVVVSAEPTTGGTIKAGMISVSLKEVELNNVIRLFATLSDANIIVPELEAGAGTVKVDINLKEVEWKPALQSILETQGFELYEKTPGTAVYSVRKKPMDAPQAMSVKIFKLDYASVSNVYDMVKTMVPDKGPTAGKISVFPARNTIIIQSTPENLMDIQAMITAVDLPRQQVFIEAKIMELSDGASEKLGIDWQMLGDDNGGFALGLEKIGGIYNQTNMVTEKHFTDIAGRSYEDVLSTAADFPARPGSFGPNDTRSTGITPTILDNKTTVKALNATLTADDFKVVLAALKGLTGAKIVSNPKVVVANEERAVIQIGSKEPNIKQETTQAQNADAVTTYNLDPARPFFEYGIKLEVTPVVNTSSNITVAINPTLSRWLKDKTVGNGGTVNTFPVTAEKTIKTTFSLASGQTAAIGGLTEITANDVERKIPVLGSLPLIGRFFSYSSKQKDQAETIIFVTVGLANPGNINMETGLPQDSTLAMRYDANSRANRQIKAEELNILNQHEAERSQAAIQKLQNAEQKRIEKKNK